MRYRLSNNVVIVIDLIQGIKRNIKQTLKDDNFEQWRDYVRPLLVQGNVLKLIEAEKSDLTWKSMIYNLPRNVLSFAVRSCIDFLPTFTNLRTWGKRVNVKCKLCNNNQTLLHVLNNCQTVLQQGRYTWRHNSILSHMFQSFKKLIGITKDTFDLFADLPGHTVTGGTLPPNILPTAQRPDIIIINNTKKLVHIIELTVPFKTNIHKAHDLKMSRYENLHSDIEQQGYKCHLNCIEVGSRGLVTADNAERLREAFRFVGGRSNSSKTLVKDLSKLAVVCSYSIWNARNEPNWDSAPYLKI